MSEEAQIHHDQLAYVRVPEKHGGDSIYGIMDTDVQRTSHNQRAIIHKYRLMNFPHPDDMDKFIAHIHNDISQKSFETLGDHTDDYVRVFSYDYTHPEANLWTEYCKVEYFPRNNQIILNFYSLHNKESIRGKVESLEEMKDFLDKNKGWEIDRYFSIMRGRIAGLYKMVTYRSGE